MENEYKLFLGPMIILQYLGKYNSVKMVICHVTDNLICAIRHQTNLNHTDRHTVKQTRTVLQNVSSTNLFKDRREKVKCL